jgi:hypothetical protein
VRKNKEGNVMGDYFQDRHSLDFSFYETDIYFNFREEYIDFVKKNSDMLFEYISLDIINNDKASYESWKYLRNRGLKPLPVFHIGGDPIWLEKYIEEGDGFLCLGGIVPNPTSTVVPILDDLWTKYLLNDSGDPKIKVHGLAVTSLTLMKRYPWFSVDSTSWVKYSSYGKILIPKYRNGSFLWLEQPSILAVGDLHKFRPYTEYKRELLEIYLSYFNIAISDFFEKGNYMRHIVNIRYYQKLNEELNKLDISVFWKSRFNDRRFFLL